MTGQARYRLERGATGFYDPRAGTELPTTDFKAFASAWHSAARGARAQVTELTEREYPHNFHTAALMAAGREFVALCHAHLPLVAFVPTRRSYSNAEFEEPPGWSGDLEVFGFTVVPQAQLMAPLSEVDTAVLSPGEWREIRFWEITTLGGVLFNSWD